MPQHETSYVPREIVFYARCFVWFGFCACVQMAGVSEKIDLDYFRSESYVQITLPTIYVCVVCVTLTFSPPPAQTFGDAIDVESLLSLNDRRYWTS